MATSNFGFYKRVTDDAAFGKRLFDLLFMEFLDEKKRREDERYPLQAGQRHAQTEPQRATPAQYADPLPTSGSPGSSDWRFAPWWRFTHTRIPDMPPTAMNVTGDL